ncbi:hypothetical protein ACFYPZ_34835 [Streptomyces sp. NPDC005506]|uniref:hypothetical protein n=1 Tax=unclassified Streptomyces TaxID=2593676 RepID=UPI0036B860DB
MVTTNLVIDAQEKRARRQRLDRIWRAEWAVSWLRTSMASTGEFAAHRAENGDAGHSQVPDAVGTRPS